METFYTFIRQSAAGIFGGLAVCFLWIDRHAMFSAVLILDRFSVLQGMNGIYSYNYRILVLKYFIISLSVAAVVCGIWILYHLVHLFRRRYIIEYNRKIELQFSMTAADFRTAAGEVVWKCLYVLFYTALFLTVLIILVPAADNMLYSFLNSTIKLERTAGVVIMLLDFCICSLIRRFLAPVVRIIYQRYFRGIQLYRKDTYER